MQKKPMFGEFAPLLSSISASEKAFSSLKVKRGNGDVEPFIVAELQDVKQGRRNYCATGMVFDATYFIPRNEDMDDYLLNTFHNMLRSSHSEQSWKGTIWICLGLNKPSNRQPFAVWKTISRYAHKYCTKIDIHGEPTLQSENNLGLRPTWTVADATLIFENL